MDITFVGGPWHGTSKAYDPPLPTAIAVAPSAVYIPWAAHPATAGVLARPLEHVQAYVLDTLMPPALLERVQDLLVHCAGPGAMTGDAAPLRNLAGRLEA